MGQRLPARKVGHDVCGQKTPQGGDQVLGLTPGGSHRKDRATDTAVVSTGKRGDERRASTRGYRDVQDRWCAPASARPGHRCAPRQNVSHYRVGDKNVEQRGEAHEGRSSWLWVGNTNAPSRRANVVGQQFRSAGVPFLLRGDQALRHESLDGVRGVADQQGNLAALGTGEVVQNVVGRIHPPWRTADANPNAQVLPSAHRLGDRTKAVVPTLPATKLEPDLGEGDVQLVMDHDEVCLLYTSPS